ncbi:MAG: glycosyltransferase [Acidobacteriota bacterium]|nr:glycosyltransferase [Acidobacteriota bacterium]
MKVAVLTQYFPTAQQVWAGHSAYQTLRLLARMCDLHVFYPEAVYPPGLAPSGARRAPLDRTWQPEGVRVTCVPYRTLPVVGRPLNGFAIASALSADVRRFAPDVILNYVVYPDGFAATRLARELRTPAVLTAIGSDLNRIPGRLVKALTQRALRQAAVVTTVSRDLARTAVSLGSHPERTVAILNGCDTTVFHPGSPDAEARSAARSALGVPASAEAIVYVGRLDLRKGLVELIDAVAELRRRRPALLCFLVGDGPDRAAVAEAIARNHAGDTITLAPATPTSGVARWMSASDLITLPSYKEGCPNVVIEALASGRPVVATNVGGIPELMDDSCGKLVPPRNTAALCEALDRTLARTWDAQEIARRHSRSWQHVADDLYRVLAQTVEQTGAQTEAQTGAQTGAQPRTTPR